MLTSQRTYKCFERVFDGDDHCCLLMFFSASFAIELLFDSFTLLLAPMLNTQSQQYLHFVYLWFVAVLRQSQLFVQVYRCRLGLVN